MKYTAFYEKKKNVDCAAYFKIR